MKRVLVLFADGFEEIEAVTQVDLLRRAGAEVVVATINRTPEVLGAHDVKIAADCTMDELQGEFDAVVVPGGSVGVNNLRADERVLSLLRKMAQEGKTVAAICAGPRALSDAGLLIGKKATCYPGLEDTLDGARWIQEPVVRDGNLITSMGPATSMLFGLALVEALFGAESRAELETDLLMHLLP